MRLFTLIFCLIPLNFAICAQNLQVANLKWWNAEYLTVIDASLIMSFDKVKKDKIIMISDSKKKAFQSFDDYKDFDIYTFGYDVDLGSTLVEIDNRDAKGLSVDSFYQLLKEGNHTFTFENPNRERFTTTINRNNYVWVDNAEISYNEKPYDYDYISSSFYQLYKNMTQADVLVDWDVDWGKMRTYDFLIIGNDPLLDKEILKEFEKVNLSPFMTRNTDNPDVLINITRDSKRTINTTYVPPKTEYIKTGSTTKKVYSWLGMDSKYQTEDHLTAVHQDGYVKNIVNSELFLEISILDASKLDSKVPPVIYKATKSFFQNNAVDSREVLKDMAGQFMHPFDYKKHIRTLSFNNQIPFAVRWGICIDGCDMSMVKHAIGKKIKYVYPTALKNYAKNNISIPQEGDIIKSINISTKDGYSLRTTTVNLKYQTLNGKTKKTQFRYYADLSPYGGIKEDDFVFNSWSCGLTPCLVTLEE